MSGIEAQDNPKTTTPREYVLKLSADEEGNFLRSTVTKQHVDPVHYALPS